MDSDKNPETSNKSVSNNEPVYLTTAEIAVRLGVSSSTVARYQTEFAADLNPFSLPGGGRGLRPDAIEVFRIIQQMKAKRASWIDIKQAIEEKFGELPTDQDTLRFKSFRRSLEAIRQAQLVMTNELHLLLREINRRLDRLEKTVRLRQSLKSDADRTHRPSRERSTAPQPEALFPDEDGPGESSE